MACKHDNNAREEEQYVDKHVITSEEDDPGPPPPNFKSPFKTLEEWLFAICDKEKPKKTISTYRLGLFEGEDDYTLCFTGTNTYEASPDHTSTRIDFAPADMYFTLPQSKYKGLKREQVLERLTSQVKEFTTTDKFKHSFLSEAKSIVVDWNGEPVWAK
jgi:hypothetical protein